MGLFLFPRPEMKKATASKGTRILYCQAYSQLKDVTLSGRIHGQAR